MKKNILFEKQLLDAFIKVCVLLTAILGLLAILGWFTGIPQLSSFDSNKIPMAFSTALLFVIYGVIIFFHYRLPSNRIVYHVGIAVSSTAILFTLILFVLSLNGIYLNVEHFGIKMNETIGGIVVGHMSPLTAFCFILVGLSFLIKLTSSGQKKYITFAFVLSVIVILISFILILSYLFGTPLLYGGNFIPPALPTSFAFLFLGISILFISGLEIWSYNKSTNAESLHSSYILILVFIILFVSIITAGYSYYKNYEKQFRVGIEHQLSSITDLKVSEIIQWRKERLGDARVFYKNINFSQLVKLYFENPKNADTKTKVHVWLKQVHDAYPYNRICLHDNKGKEQFIFPDTLGPHSTGFLRNISEIMKSGRITFMDFYRNDYDKRIYLSIFVPIFDPGNSNVIGILTMRIDPEQYLYPLLNKWPIPGKTAETLIIRREGNYAVFLNELRFKKNTALNLRNPLSEVKMPAVKAVLGEEGIVEGYDYRHENVIACIQAIPDSPWFLIARMDIAEVYEPLSERLWVIIILVVGLLIGSGSGVGLIWRQQHVKFYKDRSESAERISKLNRVYAVLSDINQAIVRIREPQELFDSACKTAVEKGGFLMAWIGKINLVNNKVDVVASKEISADYLGKLDLNCNDDESKLESACRAINNGIHIISNDVQNDINIPELHKDAVIYGCKSSGAFPLKVSNKVWGVFKLYSVDTGFFDDDEVKLLDELAMDISFAIEFAEKETERKLAEESLKSAELSFRNTLDNMMEGCQIIGSDWRYIYLNKSAVKYSHQSKEDLLGNTMMDRYPGIETSEIYAAIKHCMEARISISKELEFVYPDESKKWFEFSIQPVPEGVFILTLDITDRMRVENNEKLAKEVLEHLNCNKDSKTMVNEIIHSIKKSTGFEAIAIRLREGEDFPYYSTTGFSENFVNSERYLCSYDKDGNTIRGSDGKPLLECMCGNILLGRVDPVKSFFTKGGSFISNNTTRLISTSSDTDRMARTRNRCNSFGYESVALIPIRSSQEVIGLLQLNDHRENVFSTEIISFFEGLGSSIGIALMRNLAEEEINKINSELEERVKVRTEQLEIANKELETFSYSVSHDLRAPLRAIDGFTKMLIEGYSDKLDNEGRRISYIIRDSAQRMGQLINDLLAFSRLSRVDIRTSKIDMKNMVLSVFNELTSDETRNRIDFKLEELLPATGDPSMLKQVWINLLSNAIKFSSLKEKAVIKVTCKLENNMIIYGIIDNGAGFDMKFVSKLFGVFQRLHSSKEYEGTGVGLAIVQRVIQRHSGQVWAEGEINKGAAFYFSIPAN